jgi:hypothetical protein
MPLEFQNYNRRTKKTNLQLFSDFRSGWSKKPQWEHDCGSFLPCFRLVFVDYLTKYIGPPNYVPQLDVKYFISILRLSPTSSKHVSI